MAITKITTPLNNIELLAKINEVVDEINNYATSQPCVSDVSVSGSTITLSFSDGSTITQNVQDTVYSVATTSSDGLMSAEMVGSLNELTESVSALSTRVAALEPKKSS